MKELISKLRTIALISFALFMISVFVGLSEPTRFKFTEVQSILILVSFVLFLLIIVLQLYGLYISSYLHSEEDEGLSS